MIELPPLTFRPLIDVEYQRIRLRSVCRNEDQYQDALNISQWSLRDIWEYIMITGKLPEPGMIPYPEETLTMLRSGILKP